MVAIPGGTYLMGEGNKSLSFPVDKEWPTHEVTVKPFRLDRAEITNRAFAAFVSATGYVTDAEKFGWSFVFEPFLPEELNESVTQAVAGAEWWLAVEGATWAHPEGPPTDVGSRGDIPAVHLSWNDVERYCRWMGKRLPSEKEWERAARGGLHQKRYPWGDAAANLSQLANTFEGEFPHAPASPPPDGWLGPAPAGSFPASRYGLYHIVGNVWEYTSDAVRDGGGDSHWQRGGSFMCHVSYCYRYRTSARILNTADTSAGNTGGRCAADFEEEGTKDEL